MSPLLNCFVVINLPRSDQWVFIVWASCASMNIREICQPVLEDLSRKIRKINQHGESLMQAAAQLAVASGGMVSTPRSEQEKRQKQA